MGPGTVGDEYTDKTAFVPRQIINENEKENGYAYWIGDEGVKQVAGAKRKDRK